MFYLLNNSDFILRRNILPTNVFYQNIQNIVRNALKKLIFLIS